MRRGATAEPINIVGAGSVALVGGRGFLCGWSLSETAAAATIVTLTDGDGASDPALTGGIVIPASGNSHVPLHWPVEFKRGIFVATSAGTVIGAIWLMLVPDYFDDKFLDAALNLWSPPAT